MNKMALFAVVVSGLMLTSFHRPQGASTEMASTSPLRSISSTSFSEGLALRAHFAAKREAQRPEVPVAE